MEEGNLLKQRRNLILASLVLFVYNVGQGTFKGELPSGITAIGFKLEKPEILIWFLYAVVLYFWWRYWQYAKPNAHHFGNSYRLRLRKHPALPSLLRSHLPEEKVKELASRQFDQQRKGGFYEPNTDTLNVTKRGWRSASITFQSSVRPNADPTNPLGYEEIAVSVPAFTLYRMEIPALVRTIARDVPFSEYYLPYVFPVAALGSAAWRCWHR